MIKKRKTIYGYLSSSLPSDHCRQVRATDLVREYIAADKMRPKTILDLGCGVGNSIDFFSKHAPKAKWTGVDIDSSPEVKQRARNDGEFVTFDGVTLPFSDRYFDLVYSNQVLEHVRYPEKLLSETHRVLVQDGLFMGQTSQLEPYHSHSYWNFTIFGFKQICEDAGFELIEIRPGIDAITLIQRSYLGHPKEYSKWFVEESPLNTEIENSFQQNRLNKKKKNYRKLMYSGQFVFVCRCAR